MEQILSAALFVLLYGVSYGLVLFIIAIGLVITMGLMQIVNLAHGAFAAIGGYIAVSLMNAAGMPYLATLCAAVVAVVLLSIVLERLIYVRLYGASHLDQILMTLGVNFIVIGAITILFGPNVYPVKLPTFLQGSVDLGLRKFEVYRIFVICLGLAVVVCLWALFERTSFGARLRAAVDNRSIAQVIGIDVDRVFLLAFGIGSGLAALGGAVGAAMLPLEPYYPMKYLMLVLVVVALSGYGNIRASLGVAIIVGLIDTAGRLLVPAFGGFALYLLLILLTVWRPDGLFAGRAP
jgi:branched-chain amino acid transport system permease protein